MRRGPVNTSAEDISLRKQLVRPLQQATSLPDERWLDLQCLAQVELTSEDPSSPIEAALVPGQPDGGWRSAAPGDQIIRLIFAEPQRIRRIYLRFVETDAARTQEFVLRWSADGGRSFREIVRQQWNFSLGGATVESEDYRVDLAGVTVLELQIIPDIGGTDATASLAIMRIA